MAGPTIDLDLTRELAAVDGIARVMPWRLLEVEFHPGFGVPALAVAIAATVSAAAGWAASFRILGRKPLEILREE